MSGNDNVEAKGTSGGAEVIRLTMRRRYEVKHGLIWDTRERRIIRPPEIAIMLNGLDAVERILERPWGYDDDTD